MAAVRLQKVLAHAGVASRRAAEDLIAAGRVRVDGHLVTELGTKIDPRARVEVDGTRVVRQGGVYVLLHKPRGYVSTMSDPEGRPSVRDLVGDVSAARVYPVGRLDFNTSGALLVTNDGDFSDALMHPRRAVPKTYVVKVQGMMEERDVDRWRRGVELEDGKTLPAKVKLLRHEGDKTWLELTITEGRNLQVRRMGDATGFRVMRLARLAFAGIDTEGLAPGKWRYLTAEELGDMKKEYGVPKHVVSPPKPEAPKPSALPPGAARERHPRGGGPRKGGYGAERTSRDAQGKPARGGQGKPARGGHGKSARDGGPPSRTAHGGPETGPRYGGGAPVRRGLDVKDDWGGGIHRGSSGNRAGDDDGGGAPPRGDLGGRGGRSRTTGSGGGIGASGGGYRIKGRHG
jgi:23S rRNA pseudouridine2605 synthase